MASHTFIDLTLDDDDEVPAVTSTPIRPNNSAAADFMQPAVLPYYSSSPHIVGNAFADVPLPHHGLSLPVSPHSPVELPEGPPPPKFHVIPRKTHHLRELSLSPNASRIAEMPSKRRRLSGIPFRQTSNGTPGATAQRQSRLPSNGAQRESNGAPSHGSTQKSTPILPAGAVERRGDVTTVPRNVANETPILPRTVASKTKSQVGVCNSEAYLTPSTSKSSPNSGSQLLLTSFISTEASKPSPTPQGMRDVLQRVIIPHINSCLTKLAFDLDDTTKKNIGKKTAFKVCTIELKSQLDSNNGILPDLAKKELLHKCTLLVGIFINGAKTKLHSSPVPQTNGVHQKAKQGTETEHIVISDDGSRHSTDEDVVQRLRTRRTTRRANQLLTPSTSFTVEAPQNGPVLVTNPQQNKHKMSHGQEKRALALNSLITQRQRSVRSRTRRPPVEQNERIKQTQARPQRSQTRVAAAQSSFLEEVENLRLAGQDCNTLRPYISLSARGAINRGLEHAEQSLTPAEKSQLLDRIVHVDFVHEEVQWLRRIMHAWHESHIEAGPEQERVPLLDRDMKTQPNLLQMILKAQKNRSDTDRGLQLIKQRTEEDLRNFIQDSGKCLWQDDGPNNYNVASDTVLRIRVKQPQQRTRHTSRASISDILRDREMSRRTFGRTSQSAKARVLTSMDDAIVRESEFTGCSGDIATITWLPSDRFVCGAITHSDQANQQYNRPGNLALGSATTKTLRSVSGHRIIRPIVDKGSNSLLSMRETQDPYLYCSVTSTAFHEGSQKVLTGSFDKTVKVWDIHPDCSGMALCGTWQHDGVINFVVTSPHHNKVATAADVFQDGIRVYDLNQDNVSSSPFISYSGTRADQQSAAQLQSHITWAYYPATLQWGKAPTVAHLLLAGYSPRALQVHDDIPEDKGNTGELCLWDTVDGTRVPVTSARTQNVFEVVWHPKLPIFVAATSATGEYEDGVRTQLRIFSQSENGTFCHSKTFDCRAMDINEITLMPNSPFHFYLTASCTNGNTYVWDSSQKEDPIHVLGHGRSIDEQTLGESVEESDSGVKFAAWGRTTDRFYTGSSDGVVKAWNVRAAPGEEHIADVITLSGGISSGAFTSDHSRLLIGDSTGKLNVLRSGDLDEYEDCPPTYRMPIIPHYEARRSAASQDIVDPNPEPTARELAQKYVEARQITIHPDPYVGAVQGENYSETGLLYSPLHKNANPLLEVVEEVIDQQRERYHQKPLIIQTTHEAQPCSGVQHQENYARDLQRATLEPQTALELENAGVDFRFEDENEYEYEPDVGDLGLVDSLGEGKDDKDSGGVVAAVDTAASGGNNCFLNIAELDHFQQLRNFMCKELQVYKAFQQVEDAICDSV